MGTMSTSGDYYILTVTSEDEVPSRLKLLHERGFIFAYDAPQQLSNGVFKHYFCHTKK